MKTNEDFTHFRMVIWANFELSSPSCWLGHIYEDLGVFSCLFMAHLIFYLTQT